MTDTYDVLPDLALLLDAALRYGRDSWAYAERIAEAIGLDADAGPEAAENALRGALGLKACRCMIDGPGEVLPFACPVHGIPCEGCGQVEGCSEDCDGEPRNLVTGVPVTNTMRDSTGDEIRFGLIGGAVLIGCDGSPLILGDDAKREEFGQLWVRTCHEAEAARAAETET